MMDNPETLQTAAQFGVAGLMGMLWLWERLYSRKREQQLTEAHQRITAQQIELKTLIDLVSRNTAAIERFQQTQQRIAEALERIDTGRRAA
jgi:hypothetical protein